jgi:parallel beta-helix repeat protein
MRYLGSVFVLFLLLLPLYAAEANEFVVDQKHPAASDANDGSYKRPWKTVAHAAKVAIAGDSVTVKDGIYRESIEVTNSGTASRLITFKASGKNVVVKGSDVVTGWKLWKGRIWKKENWDVNSQQVFVDEKILDQIGGNPFYSPDRLPAVGRGVGDLTPGAFYYDSKGKTLFIRLRDGDNPNRHKIEVSVRPWLFLVRENNYIKLEGFTFQHSNTTAVIKTGWPAVNISGDNCIAENNRISWCDFTGLGGAGNDLIIRNNISNYNGNSGMGFSGRGILMDGNITNFNNYRKFNPEWHAGGVKNGNFVNSIIRNHVAQENIGSGIWCDINCSDVVIESSMAQKNEGMGIFYEISKKGLIKNNIVSENKLHGIYISASQDCLVLNNLAYANMRGIVLHGVPRTEFGQRYLLQNNLIENNIMVNNTNADLVLAKPSPDAMGNMSDYNLFYQLNGILNNRLDYAGAMTTLVQWQKTSGNDTHSLVGNPLFVNEAKRNFRLMIASPAIGTGRFNYLVENDLFGTKRGKRNDLGPYSYAINP